MPALRLLFFFFNDTATTEIYTLSLHDALPICTYPRDTPEDFQREVHAGLEQALRRDRKSTRLNSSHLVISYAVFCLKKKKKPFFLRHYPQDRQARMAAAGHRRRRLLLDEDVGH